MDELTDPLHIHNISNFDGEVVLRLCLPAVVEEILSCIINFHLNNHLGPGPGKSSQEQLIAQICRRRDIYCFHRSINLFIYQHRESQRTENISSLHNVENNCMIG